MQPSFTIECAAEDGYYVVARQQSMHEFQTVLYAGTLLGALAFVEAKFEEIEENQKEIDRAEQEALSSKPGGVGISSVDTTDHA